MMQNYTETLPEGYTECFRVDAKNKKIGLWLNFFGLLLTFGAAAVLWLAVCPRVVFDRSVLLWELIFCGTLIVYLVLHEFAHGVVYKAMTHQKLTFGLTLTVAFCGVPNGYVSRRTAMASLAAPLAVFTTVFGAWMLFSPDGAPKATGLLLLAVHWGGCVGDLYDLGLFLFRFRDPETLMRDTGPTQTFYQRNTNCIK